MSSHQHQPRTPANPPWIWSGVHGASGIVHPFLAIRDDPQGRYSGLGVHFDSINSILAGSGGLLLIKRSPLRGRAALLRSMRLLGATIHDKNVNGHLFFADVVVDDPIHTMNLIEIDVEAGTWKLHDWRYSLQCLHTHCAEFVNTPFLRMRGLTDHGTHQALNTQTLESRRRGRLLENFQIVECMGELYAVIPMGLSEYLPMSLRSQRTLTEVVHEYANFGLSFMPLQFLIVNMRGDGFVHGVLRILVPEDVSSVDGLEYGIDNEERQKKLVDLLRVEPLDGFSWGFSCVAEGSVIWVALLDYALQYDVVTGVSKTEIIGHSDPETSLDIWVERVPYRPSGMKS